VGWSKWEEIDIIKTPGLNAGWPYFEGLATNPFFEISNQVNEDEHYTTREFAIFNILGFAICCSKPII
jgi:hypothetical protein